MPFTVEQFFGIFRAYNVAVWPAQWVLTAAGVVALAGVLSRRTLAIRAGLLVLAVLWLWMAIAYHWAHFRSINPAATIFALLFVSGAGVLLWTGLQLRPREHEAPRSWREAVSLLLAIYGLAVYPLLNPLFGHAFPEAPGFGLPCPTTIFTIGVLGLIPPRPPRAALVVPVAWSAVGTTAAVLLGVTQDYVLGLAGLWGVWSWTSKRHCT